MRAKTPPRHWSKADDELLLAAPRHAAGMAAAAKALNRSVEATKYRLFLIRNDSRAVPNGETMVRAQTREKDVIFVAKLVLLGGFPRSIPIGKRQTIWIDLDGRPWQERTAA